MRPLLVVVSLVLALAAGLSSARAASPAVSGRIVDQSNLPLPGVQVTVVTAAAQDPPPSQFTVTDGDGRFSFDLDSGRYLLTAELQGFARIERPIVVAGESVVLDLTMAIGAVQEQVSVVAPREDPIVGSPTAAAQATITREVIDSAMLPNNSYDDVLPLVPNVVRGPDGLISIAGARAPQGQVLLNGRTQNDPVFGEPDLMLPLDPIESVQVLSTGYPSEYGRASGGVTLIAMRAGADTFRFDANSFDPRLHFIDGGVHGIEAWEPNVGLSGPIVRGRAWFTQGLDYRFVRDTFRTLAGEQDSRYDAVLSWSSFDWNVAPAHHLSVWAAADPQRTDHALVNAFTGPGASAELRRGGWRGAVDDRGVIGSGTTIETGFQLSSLPTRITPTGRTIYQLGHDLTRGSYFNRQDRTASRAELNETVTHVFTSGSSAHLLKVGGSVGAIDFAGVNQSGAVEQFRSDGSVARTIAFSGPAYLSAAGRELAAFLQDTWTATPALTVDAGVRYDRSTVVGDGLLAPRVGATWHIDNRTTVSGAAGLFGDKVMLAPTAFDAMQSRTVTEFDQSGAAIGPPVTYVNRIGGPLRMPRASAWHMQLDRRFDSGIVARAMYQQRTGSNEPIVNPVTGPDGAALVLDSTGSSRARSLETTLGYRSRAENFELFASYVRSSSTGDLNDVVAIAGNAMEPFVQSNQAGPLAADVPNRLLAWGMLRLPSRITVAPFLEVRDGFPFSPIDDSWRYVGPRNGARFPTFASLDLFVNKIVRLPAGLPTARIGLKIYNITGAENARDIQRDVDRPDFGATYNPIRRDVRGVFELLWGERD